MSTPPSECVTPALKLNWQELHDRLHKLEQMLAGLELPPIEEQKKILKRRAAALAQTETQVQEAGNEVEFVAFQVNGEEYGFESKYLVEVIPLKDLTPLPSVPALVAGIVNYRGQILTVLDLRALFEMSVQTTDAPQFVLVLQTLGKEFGILAQAVSGLQRLPREQLQPPPPTLAGTRVELLEGLTPGRLSLLDARRLLLSDKLLPSDFTA